jgi:L-ascorbate metabolism protein UlaG (beta-lactamase superfamily)
VVFAGPKRVRPPGIRFEDLPHIDAVIVSHDHYDHMDLPTLKRLQKEHHPRFVVPLGNAAILESAGILGAVELDWWQSDAVAPGVKVTATPSQHFSNRGAFDQGNALWASYVIEGKSGRVYFAGDTGYGPHFKEIARRLGAPRLALLPIGAFRPRWFMGPVHMAPEEAVKAAKDLGAALSLGIHFGTFRLADDGEDEPAAQLAQTLANEPGVRFEVPQFGVGRDVPPP